MKPAHGNRRRLRRDSRPQGLEVKRAQPRSSPSPWSRRPCGRAHHTLSPAAPSTAAGPSRAGMSDAGQPDARPCGIILFFSDSPIPQCEHSERASPPSLAVGVQHTSVRCEKQKEQVVRTPFSLRRSLRSSSSSQRASCRRAMGNSVALPETEPLSQLCGPNSISGGAFGLGRALLSAARAVVVRRGAAAGVGRAVRHDGHEQPAQRQLPGARAARDRPAPAGHQARKARRSSSSRRAAASSWRASSCGT